MTHVDKIKKKKGILDARWQIMRQVREFFWDKTFQEVETPLITAHGGQEPYLTPMNVNVMNEQGRVHTGYLHTSPEYTMKKMLAAGYERIFFLGKTFRNKESFGGSHNPEFTMLEWYRTDADMYAIMDDIDALLSHLGYDKPVTRVTMRGLWRETIHVELDQRLTQETMYELCRQKGYQATEDEAYEDLFYRIFLNEIEPTLTDKGAVIISQYPAQMAALARLSEKDNRYAERFELYINGVEIANAFSELTDGEEQQRRFEVEQETRRKLGKKVFLIDEEFIAAVDAMPPSAGIALGIDRLVQVITDCQNIDDVVVLGASSLFKQ